MGLPHNRTFLNNSYNDKGMSSEVQEPKTRYKIRYLNEGQHLYLRWLVDWSPVCWNRIASGFRAHPGIC